MKVFTESDLGELLEEARQACGRDGERLAEYLASRLPDDAKVRQRVEVVIFDFTGTRVKLELRPPTDVTDTSVNTTDTSVTTEVDLCTVCGQPLAIGDWPCVTTPRPHGKSVQTDPFKSYYDVALGREITSLGDRWNAMKPEGTQVFRTSDGREVATEGRGRLVYREKMSPGDLSARRDRLEQQKTERQRGHRP